MADRILARFPLSEADGFSYTEIFAAVENGKAVTYEKSTGSLGVILHGPFVWSNERVALSVAMANAGWGHLDRRSQRIAEADVEIRRVRAERGIDEGQVTS